MLNIATFQFAYGQRNSPPGKLLKMQDALAVQYGTTLCIEQEQSSNVQEQPINSDSIWLSVADGVSSSPHAALASRTLLQTLHENVPPELFQNSGQTALFVRELPKLVRSAFSKWQERYATEQNEGASTTLASLIIVNGQICAINCGDSRIWRIRKDHGEQLQWTQLSIDHTFFQHMLETGEIEYETMEEKTQYASIYQGLMHCLTLGDNMVEGDWMQDDDLGYSTPPFVSQPHLHIFNGNVKPGDVYVLATDGLHDSLNEQALYQLWQANASLQTNVEALSLAYKKAGCLDDCSIIACAIT